MIGESVGGLVARSTGVRGCWLKLKSCSRLPSTGSSSWTSGRPSVFGLSRTPPRKSSSMNLRYASLLSVWWSM